MREKQREGERAGEVSATGLRRDSSEDNRNNVNEHDPPERNEQIPQKVAL